MRIDSRLDHVGDDMINGAATVVIALHSKGCRQIIMALQARHEMFFYEFRGNEEAHLRAIIVA